MQNGYLDNLLNKKSIIQGSIRIFLEFKDYIDLNLKVYVQLVNSFNCALEIHLKNYNR